MANTVEHPTTLSILKSVHQNPRRTNISNNGLNVSSTSGIRTAGIVISPSLFDGAGDYTLTFDLTSYIGDSNDNALAEIWSGSGYNLTNNTSPDGLMVDTYSSSLKEFGNASAQLLADASLATASNGNQLGFTYDGSSAIAVFLGVKTDGWPFPSATFDNVSITTNFNVVPEPNAAMLLGIAGTCILLIRRRNS